MFEHMNWGKKNRLGSIVAPDGRALMLAIDHGYFMGSTHGMEKPAQAIEKLLPHVDSLMLSPGILTTCIDPAFDKGVVLRASGGNSILDPDIDDEELILSAAQAVRMNASAVAVSIFVGSEHGHQTIMNLTDMIAQASEFDLPVLGVTGVGKALHDRKEKRYLSHAARLCAEMGADIVKTYYCEGFEEVAAKTPAPIVVAGGPKLDTYRDVIELTWRAIREGAIGVDMGRNIWQSDYPAAILQGVKAVIHGNASVNEAMEIVNELSTPENARRELFKVTDQDIADSAVH